MSELPPGLKKKRRKDGRIELIHKDDAGQDYTALVTETTEITDKDVESLRVGDREHSTAKEFVDHFVKRKEANDKKFEDEVFKEDFEVMETIMRDAYRRSPRQCDRPAGPTKVVFTTNRKYRLGWERAFGKQGIPE